MVCVDLVGVLQAVGALQKARDGDAFVLLDPSVTSALLRVLPADYVTFNDLDVRAHDGALADLLPIEAEDRHHELWQYFGDTLSDRQWHSAGMYNECLAPRVVGMELIMPLPAAPGVARRLVFFRGPGRPFSDADRDMAVLLQPHIADALRLQSRRAATRLLTGRQCELLRLVAAGHDNIAIACELGLSPATVRKHLENAFARLGVSSRTAAVAKIYPDATWR